MPTLTPTSFLTLPRTGHVDIVAVGFDAGIQLGEYSKGYDRGACHEGVAFGGRGIAQLLTGVVLGSHIKGRLRSLLLR